MTTAPTVKGTVPTEATTRERLLDAAAAVFETRGYEGARLQDIARAAGLTTGAVYANFRGKDELLVAAIGARAGLELDGLLTGVSARELPALLEALAGRFADPAGPHPLLVDAVAASRRDPGLAATLRSDVVGREDLLAGLAERARSEGTLAGDVEPATFARFCVTLALGALMMRTLGVPAVARDDWHALISRLLDAVTEEAVVGTAQEDQQ
ncbi:MAG: TetR family transcriptional regulator [Actinomycetota bacterium]